MNAVIALCLRKADGETFVFLFREETKEQALKILGKFAADPELNLPNSNGG